MKNWFIHCSVFLVMMLSPSWLFAKEVVMAFSKEIPPYIFEKSNNGIEIDIISSALAFKGHTLKPIYFPLGRVPYAFSSKLVDAAMGDMGVDLKADGGYYADPAVIYDNVFITLKSNNFTINTPKNIEQLTVVSFQGADKRYPKWLTKVKENKMFFGISNQSAQVQLLYLQRYDVALIDRYIFQYFSNQLQLTDKVEIQEVVEHQFSVSNVEDYRPVFRLKDVRDDFNLGLKNLKDSGEFQKIYAKYLE